MHASLQIAAARDERQRGKVELSDLLDGVLREA
jgi:hypothetical protein